MCLALQYEGIYIADFIVHKLLLNFYIYVLQLVESNLETYRNQKEGELRKLLGEKSRFQEEMKAYSLKIDSLQLTIDQLNSSKEQYEEEVNQKRYIYILRRSNSSRQHSRCYIADGEGQR